MNVSVLTACIPGAQHILSELRTGLLTINVESESPDASRYGSVFGTNSEPLRTHISAKSNDTKVWEMTRMNSGSAAKTSGKDKDADAALFQASQRTNSVQSGAISAMKRHTIAYS